MVGSTFLIAAGLTVGATLLVLWAFRRPTKSKSPANARKAPGDRTEQWGVRITAPAKDLACPQAQKLMDKNFALTEKPQLPVADCPFPHQCECHYTKLFDRRKHERRSGSERRREGIRLEQEREPRRSGKDRRRRVDWT